MTDPLDTIQRVVQCAPPNALSQIADALGYDQAWLDQCAADARDAAAFRAILQHCAEMKLSFTRENKVRQIRFVIKASTLTSDGYQDQVRRTVEELATVGVELWPPEAIPGEPE